MATAFQKRFASKLAKTTVSGNYASVSDGKLVGHRRAAAAPKQAFRKKPPSATVSDASENQETGRRRFSIEDLDYMEMNDDRAPIRSVGPRSGTKQRATKKSTKNKERNFAFQKIGMDAPGPNIAHNRDPESFYKKPRETRHAVNERRVKTEKDHLHFSRKSRHTEYTPYTLKDYKSKEPKQYQELGRLPADLSREDLVKKREKNERVKEYARALRALNAPTSRQKMSPVREVEEARKKKLAEAKKKSARQKAIEFAKRRVPRPKVEKNYEEERKTRISNARKKEMTERHEELARTGMGMGTYDLAFFDRLDESHE